MQSGCSQYLDADDVTSRGCLWVAFRLWQHARVKLILKAKNELNYWVLQISNRWFKINTLTSFSSLVSSCRRFEISSFTSSDCKIRCDMSTTLHDDWVSRDTDFWMKRHRGQIALLFQLKACFSRRVQHADDFRELLLQLVWTSANVKTICTCIK